MIFMSEVVDRVDLATQGLLTYSPAAQKELSIALDRSAGDERRLYAVGFHQGAMVGLGIEGANRLRAAEALHFAEKNTFEEILARLDRMRIVKFPQANRDEIVEACGVLAGYWEQTLEAPGALECWWCGRRIVDGLDDYGTCFDGKTCVRCDVNGVDHTYGCNRETRADTYLED